MRYTTVIDISEFQQVYKNHNARLVYFHLALKSGYHDSDRDKVNVSIRRLAADCGLSVSALRHAVSLLERNGLVKRQDGVWHVLKWVVQEIPTPRTQKGAGKASTETNSMAARYDAEVEQWRQKVYSAVRSMTKEELQAWRTELTEGRRCNHRGVSIAANKDNIKWLTSIIDKL